MVVWIFVQVKKSDSVLFPFFVIKFHVGFFLFFFVFFTHDGKKLSLKHLSFVYLSDSNLELSAFRTQDHFERC